MAAPHARMKPVSTPNPPLPPDTSGGTPYGYNRGSSQSAWTAPPGSPGTGGPHDYYPSGMPTQPPTPGFKRKSHRWLIPTIVIPLAILVALAVLGSTVAKPAPASTTMPNYVGQDCKQAQSALDRRIADHDDRNRSWQDDSMAKESPSICTGNIVIRTDPPPGTRIDLKFRESIAVHWWAIEPAAYQWYQQHPKMPNYIGKTLAANPTALYDPDTPLANYVTENPDYSLLGQPSDTGWYEQGPHKIVSTVPAPGKPLRIGQKIVFNTQVQRGNWMPFDDTGPGETGGFGGPHFGVCIGKWIFHICT